MTLYCADISVSDAMVSVYMTRLMLTSDLNSDDLTETTGVR